MTDQPGILSERRNTRQIYVGSVPIGGDAPIAVQSMTNTPTEDVAATVAQIKRLEKAGCEIIRVAVPTRKAADAITAIRDAVSIPVIADIHFDYRLAIAAAEAGANGLRINPGNIGSHDKIKVVVDCAKQHGIAIRVGVNAGSLEKDLIAAYNGVTAQGLAESGLRNIALLESLGFDAIKLSIKASDVPKTLLAHRLLADRTDVPLHIGITEAGTLIPGVVKSGIGLGMLLAGGIGDTLRVSLTRDPVDEVRVAYEILKTLGIRRFGPEIVSCPTCGRCRIDLVRIAEAVEAQLTGCRLPIKVAIMGCVVNGPGEARDADIGIAGGNNQGILFEKGKIVEKIPQSQLVDVLIRKIKKMETALS
ncbi:MAG: 4-hydroxy-3-methylbut-2-en-1-yl diphosphate synthase [Deltaproteobacteria bacterium]|nr:MAG: 4-hydroxy-3-methylbut-2-en-1-yl diphosphate synthase [Deltaproteobacteria bacterium]